VVPVPALTAAFTTLVWPSHNAASSALHQVQALDHVGDCRHVGCGQQRHTLFPMSTSTLKALTMDLIGLQTPCSIILAVWSSIQNRHRRAGLRPPIHGPNEFSAWTSLLASLQGAPHTLLYPIHRSMVQRLLA
jgi:hypothetical protein